MDPLKEMFNKSFFEKFLREFLEVYAGFNSEKFLKEMLQNLDELSLNQRMRKTSVLLKKHLPNDFIKSVEIMKKVIPNTKVGYTNLVFPDFVGLYGHDCPTYSLEALRYFTQFGSSEFAIREYLKRDFDATLKVIITWAKDKNAHVRRLASEGSRPRLPWSFKLDRVIQDPHSTKDILESLKEDESLYVRKSVANHLNDISKENAAYMINLVNSWNKSHPHTAWIIKHASRTLIKKGNPDSLKIFSYEKNVQLNVENLKLSKVRIKLGESLSFSFHLISKKAKTQKLVVDYLIHYRKKSGELSPKVFKLKDVQLKPKETLKITKKQLFKDFTTRKHFAGEHILEIQVNGKIFAKHNFKVIL
jgi:3-methyladenine DNA glycosylase AlkC